MLRKGVLPTPADGRSVRKGRPGPHRYLIEGKLAWWRLQLSSAAQFSLRCGGYPPASGDPESVSSSDGGIALLAAVAKRARLFATIAPLFADRRDSSRVLHSMEHMLSIRVIGLAADSFDCSDSKDIHRDPMLRFGASIRSLNLPSRPMLSRFEHKPTLPLRRPAENFLGFCTQDPQPNGFA